MRTIGLFLGTTEDSYGKEVVRGVLDGLAGRGIRLICFTAGTLHSSHGYEAQRNVLYDLVDDRSVDALIVAGSLSHNVGPEELEAFCHRYDPLPLVTISITLPGTPSVVTDNRAGFAMVVDHLLEDHGYTRLAFVGGPPGQQEAETRKAVFLEKMAAAGLDVVPAWMVHGDYTRASGVEAGRQLQRALDQSPQTPRFQAIVSANDSMALGIHDHFSSLGWEFPRDCALTGFDDLPESRLHSPPLTTVFQSYRRLADEAARLVVRILDKRTALPITAIRPHLICRTSCGCQPRPRTGLSSEAYEAALSACEVALTQEGREGALTSDLMDRLRGTTESMLTSDSFPHLLDILHDNLVHMGYPGFWLSLFEDPTRPAISSRLHLSKTPTGTVLTSVAGRPFPSRELIPGGLTELNQADMLVVEALYSRDYRMGFIVFATDQAGSQITGTLRGQISGALQAVLLLEERKQAERQLIQAEKMAALGSLVAGVAHEINTPLGVAITASSFLADQATEVMTKLKGGMITKTELNGLLEDIRQAGNSIQANLLRAADLVSSFKQVSADQTSEQRRVFALKEYLRETLVSLHFQWKKRDIEVELEGDDDPILDSFPGAIVQIISNLVSNSLFHAFPPGTKGRITLGLEDRDPGVLLWYADDGIGIPYAHQKQVFDPFFTTKRGQGGTGLGLHIVFNVVTNILGGTIVFTSIPGEGTRFEMTLPKKAPG